MSGEPALLLSLQKHRRYTKHWWKKKGIQWEIFNFFILFPTESDLPWERVGTTSTRTLWHTGTQSPALIQKDGNYAFIWEGSSEAHLPAKSRQRQGELRQPSCRWPQQREASVKGPRGVQRKRRAWQGTGQGRRTKSWWWVPPLSHYGGVPLHW